MKIIQAIKDIRLDNMLCRLGQHKWTLWSIEEVPLVPIIDHSMLDIELDDLFIETCTRTCSRCQAQQTKRVFHW